MPIAGLSDRRRLPRLGKIRLGIKVDNKSGNGQHPQAVDYFVFTFNEGTPEAIQKQVRHLYGEKPTRLPVLLPGEDQEVVASQYLRAYTGSGLKCKGDGITADRMIDMKTAEQRHDPNLGDYLYGEFAHGDSEKTARTIIPCPYRDCPYYQRKECKESMILQVVLYELPMLGVFQIDTSSANSIIDVNSGLDLIKTGFGQITNIELVLALEPRQASPDGKRKTIHTLHIYCEDIRRAQQRITSGSRLALLPPPPDEQTLPSGLYPKAEGLSEEDDEQDPPATQTSRQVIDQQPAAERLGPGARPGPVPDPRAPAAPAPAAPLVAGAPASDANRAMSDFWGTIRGWGRDAEWALQQLGVKTMATWLNDGKTLDNAITVLEAIDRKLRTEQAPTTQPAVAEPTILTNDPKLDQLLQEFAQILADLKSPRDMAWAFRVMGVASWDEWFNKGHNLSDAKRMTRQAFKLEQAEKKAAKPDKKAAISSAQGSPVAAPVQSATKPDGSLPPDPREKRFLQDAAESFKIPPGDVYGLLKVGGWAELMTRHGDSDFKAWIELGNLVEARTPGP